MDSLAMNNPVHDIQYRTRNPKFSWHRKDHHKPYQHLLQALSLVNIVHDRCNLYKKLI